MVTATLLYSLLSVSLLPLTSSFVATPAFRAKLQTCPTSSSAKHLKIPFTPKSDDQGSSDEIKEKKIGMSGLFQLITAGMGSPFLGDFEGVDKETGNFMFSLEANNLTDEVRISSTGVCMHLPLPPSDTHFT
jgi:hypothetical protein